MLFRDRAQAAHLLARQLAGSKGQNPLILAIPRGAVPMAKILAEELGGEIDVVLVRKLGAPGNPEYALGAVAESGEVLLRDSPDVDGAPPGYIDAETERQLAVLRERRATYTPGRRPIDPRDRIVIVLDDGIATGATLQAALSLTRARQPRQLIAAAAVAPESALAEIRALADEVVCLETPASFSAVSEFFASFREVDDREVIAILRGRPLSPS